MPCDISFHLEEPNDGFNQWNVGLSHNLVRNAYIRNYTPRFKINRSKVKPISIKTAEDLPDIPLVLLSPKTSPEFPGKISLFEFEHPEECIYFVGSNRMPLNVKQMGNRKPDHSVYIPTETVHSMYSWTAITIALYHRNYW